MVVVHSGVLILLIVVYNCSLFGGFPALSFPDHQALLNYNVNPLFRYPYLLFSLLAHAIL